MVKKSLIALIKWLNNLPLFRTSWTGLPAVAATEGDDLKQNGSNVLPF